MEFFDEVMLSLITVLFALLISKIASAAAEHGRDRPLRSAGRSVELEEFRPQRIASEARDEAVEDDDGLGIEKRSEAADLVIGESADEFDGKLVNLEEYVKGLDDDDVKLVDFELEEERSQVVDLVIEETVTKIEADDAESLEIRSQTHEESCGGEIERGEKSGIGEKEGSLLYGEDDWEGIEKSQAEKLFGAAVGYVGSEGGGNALSKLGDDVKKQLYGLHKVATEGPCHEPQPLALKVTARAKWHSWQRLGNMNPEVAMEQYIALLSESIPGWMGDPGVDAKQGEGDDTPDVGMYKPEVPNPSSSLHGQSTSSGAQRFEDPSSVEVDKPTSSPNLFEKGLTKTFILDLLSPTRVRFLTFYW